MKSAWARYREELMGTQFIEYDWGFLSYSHAPDAIFLEDIWIEPSSRKTGLGSKLISELKTIAKQTNKNLIILSIYIERNNFSDNLQAALARGFQPLKAEANILWLKCSVDGGNV